MTSKTLCQIPGVTVHQPPWLSGFWRGASTPEREHHWNTQLHLQRGLWSPETTESDTYMVSTLEKPTLRGSKCQRGTRERAHFRVCVAQLGGSRAAEISFTHWLWQNPVHLQDWATHPWLSAAGRGYDWKGITLTMCEWSEQPKWEWFHWTIWHKTWKFHHSIVEPKSAEGLNQFHGHLFSNIWLKRR